ncbi:hypothetical protein BC833DRAFT_611699 [Globomyces pollinis-pini]|nr:hypothetical protein BC833DRAFT_611699 [Globomyces pollinis-pini]
MVEIASECLNTNRLCIDSQNITIGIPTTIYWPVNLIPVEVDTERLTVSLYNGDASTLIDPCTSNSPLGTYPVKPRATSNTFINSSSIIIPTSERLSNLIKTNNQFYLQLKDSLNRQCILGPNIGSGYAGNVPLVLSPTSTTTTSSTPTNTSGSGSSDNYSPVVRYSLLIVALMILVIAIISVFIAICIYTRKVNKLDAEATNDQNNFKNRGVTSLEELPNVKMSNSTLGLIPHSDTSNSEVSDLPKAHVRPSIDAQSDPDSINRVIKQF